MRMKQKGLTISVIASETSFSRETNQNYLDGKYSASRIYSDVYYN